MKKRLGFMVWVITVMLLAIPAIAHDSQEVTINEGALYTVTREVSLALAYTGLPVPTLMRLRNEGEEWPEWEPYDATKQWVLSEKDGVKTVYVETRYWAKVGWRTLSDNSSITFDTTPPVMSAVRSVEPNASGWNNTDVSVTFQATDALSGVASIAGDTIVTTEGENQFVTGQAVDKAGNVATFGVAGISIDKTLPVITGMLSPAHNANGWNNTDVSVTFQAADALSGVASIAGDTIVTTEGENQSVTGQAVDKAGNIASFNVVVHLDRTPPNVSARANPGADSMVWNNTDVSVSFEATDQVSGIDSVAGHTFLTEEGANQSVTGTAVDKAGNVASGTSTNINIDKALPALPLLVSGTDRKPIGEPRDVLTLLSSFEGFSSTEPIFAVGAQFFDGDGSIAADAIVTLMIQEILSSPEPGAASYRMAWLTTCTYSSVSQQYYAMFPATSLADGVYELWFTTNTRQSVRARIVLGQTP